MERGESVPDIITVSKLAKILKTDLNYFSDGFQIDTSENVSVDTLNKEVSACKLDGKKNWDMSRGNWVDADFSGLKNLNEKFSSSNMQKSKFVDSVLSRLRLKNNNIDCCDFTGSDISRSHIQNSYLINSLFENCKLKDAEFSGSHIKGCDFSAADFSGAVFKSSSLHKNTMTGTVLKHTSFNTSDFADIVFDTNVEDCYFENCSFSKVTFKGAKFINTFFKGRSLKHIKFIDCEADRMTYEFLKSDKANLDGVTLV